MMKRRPPPNVNTTYYDNLKGIDYSKDPSQIDKSHSPFMVNLIPDKGGTLEKRLGFRTIFTVEAPVNGIFYAYINQKVKRLVHGGTKLYDCTENEPVLLYSDISSSKSQGFAMQHENKNKFFLMTGADFLVYDGETVKKVQDIAKIPTVLISRKPSGGGTPLDAVNLLQSKRVVRFLGTATDKTYILPSTDIDEEKVTAEKKTASGMTTLVEGTDFTVNRETGQVTFNTAPGVSPVEGEDNVYITYSKTVEGYADRVLKCTVYAYFGLGGSNRVFISGNEKNRNYDWWSAINDPTYFPDLNYAVMGSEDTAIMGYSKIGEYLTVIKEDNSQDTTIYIRSAQMVSNDAVFPIKQGVTGTGAISKQSFVSLVDEPLFLSRNGIYAITSNTSTAERTLQNRSFFIDRALTKEANLENAISCEWNGFYLLGINDKVYILDSRQKAGAKDSAFIYECFLWDNIPATCFLSINGELYYGTTDGKVCKMNTDIKDMSRYSDDNKAIKAAWASALDYDGLPQYLKTMNKKGCVVTLKPFVRSSVKIGVKTEKDNIEKIIKNGFIDIFDWEDIDFARFTFNSNDNASQIVIGTKIKKYKGLQFVLVSDNVNEGFGVLNIVKSYIVVNFLKR